MEFFARDLPLLIQYGIVLIIGITGSLLGALCGGGGGMVSVPAMMFVGFPPVTAISSIAGASIGHSLGGISKFLRNGFRIKNYKQFIILSILGAVGGVIGIQILVSIDEQLLQKLVGVLLLLLLPVLLYKKNEHDALSKSSQIKRIIGALVFFCIGVYITFFGPNSGFFVVYGLLYFFGYDIIQSHFLSTAFFLCVQVIALPVMFLKGIVSLPIIAVLFVGKFIGAYLGIHLMLKLDPLRVKRLMGIMIVIIAVKILFF